MVDLVKISEFLLDEANTDSQINNHPYWRSACWKIFPKTGFWFCLC